MINLIRSSHSLVPIALPLEITTTKVTTATVKATTVVVHLPVLVSILVRFVVVLLDQDVSSPPRLTTRLQYHLRLISCYQ